MPVDGVGELRFTCAYAINGFNPALLITLRYSPSSWYMGVRWLLSPFNLKTHHGQTSILLDTKIVTLPLPLPSLYVAAFVRRTTSSTDLHPLLKRSLYFLWIFITLYYILYTGCGTFLKEYVITHALWIRNIHRCP
jgi:hypothetical protein